MVPAGPPVDQTMSKLRPLLAPGARPVTVVLQAKVPAEDVAAYVTGPTLAEVSTDTVTMALLSTVPVKVTLP